MFRSITHTQVYSGSFIFKRKAVYYGDRTPDYIDIYSCKTKQSVWDEFYKKYPKDIIKEIISFRITKYYIEKSFFWWIKNRPKRYVANTLYWMADKLEKLAYKLCN